MINPRALRRQATTRSQVDFAEDTLVYGEDDAFPLRMAQAVQDSPAATACIGTKAQFIQGASFSDKELMKVKINKHGQTLWDLHCSLSKVLALFEGFAVLFKFNPKLKITNVYILAFESVRFVKPADDLATEITHVKYNPYFGTSEFKKEYTTKYYTFNLKELPNQINAEGTQFNGQVYYYGSTRPLYRFYPVPEYWSAKKWISVDAKIQEFHDENLENGFFQSVLMTMIGDPSQPSKNPAYQTTVVGDDGIKRTKSTKTVGEEFNDQMSQNFSGSKKAGNIMALWAGNKDQAPTIEGFPSNGNAELFDTIQNLTTKNITIATEVPAILANIHEGVSLGSDGNTIQKSVELMQSRVISKQSILTEFYNNILLPNLEEVPAGRVEIVHFNPITTKVELEKQFWDFLNEAERVSFMKKNFPGIEIIRVATAPATVTTLDQPPTQANEALKNINLQQLDRIQKIAARFSIGLVDPSNKKALTFDQAKTLLLSYGLTESDIPNWLVTPEEI